MNLLTGSKRNLVVSVAVFLLFCTASSELMGPGENQNNKVWAVQPPSEAIIRLHVIADGNDQFSRQFKMKIVEEVRYQLAHKSFGRYNQDYRLYLQENLPFLEESLESYAAALLKSPPAITVSLSQEEFPLRVYGRAIYPPGKYTALIVVIGTGKGDNWWCLLFPSLCLPFVQADKPAVERATTPDIQKITPRKSEMAPDFRETERSWKSFLADRWNRWFRDN